MRIAFYKEDTYYLGSGQTGFNIYSKIDNQRITGIKSSEIDWVYDSRIWVKARGCNALFEGMTEEGKMCLNVCPSEDVDILGAVQVDRGIYNVELPLEEVERVWEERMPYLDFKYPEGLPTVAELDVSDLKDTTKRFR